jgi:hypothetical protein
MNTNVSLTKSSEDRIRDSVNEGIGIGMTFSA